MPGLIFLIKINIHIFRAMDIDRRLQPNPAIRDALEYIIKVKKLIVYPKL
jgi:hypothetical protein